MLSFGRHEQGKSRTIGHAHSAATKSEWMDHGKKPGLAPNIWLVRMPPNSEIGSHFHTQNQFQVFVEGSGRIGARPVGPVTAHYAGAFTGYGPLVAGPEGLAYFTVRAGHDPGAQYLPEARERHQRGPRQVWTGPVLALQSANGEPIDASDSTFRHIDSDGAMYVDFRTVRQGELLSLKAGNCEGVFLCVLSGGVVVDGQALARHEWLFATPDEGTLIVSGAEGGAEVLLLQMPFLDHAYRPVATA